MTLDDIKKTIETAIPQAQVYVMDPMNDGLHLQAFVISDAFDGVSLIQQHQMVMNPLKEGILIIIFTAKALSTERISFVLLISTSPYALCSVFHAFFPTTRIHPHLSGKCHFRKRIAECIP